jgi:Fe-S-cluster containining protein
MAQTLAAERRLTLSLSTPAGEVSSQLDVPTGFVPLHGIVPIVQRLSADAQAVEEQRARDAGGRVSCRDGCAACCRMLVPVSAPEALALYAHVSALPADERAAIQTKSQEAQEHLKREGILDTLWAIAEADEQIRDPELEPVNRAYYGLRLPCVFLTNERCSIYDRRPSACRELLVTSPAEWCDDLMNHEVHAVPAPIRSATALGLLTAELHGGPARLIPLPIALDWAQRHAGEYGGQYAGLDLLDKTLESVSHVLTMEFAERASRPAPPATAPDEGLPT